MMKYHGTIIVCLHLKRWSITCAGENRVPGALITLQVGVEEVSYHLGKPSLTKFSVYLPHGMPVYS